MNANDKQRMHQDTLLVLIVTLLTYLVAGYFDLAERYIDWTALGEIYQLDEAVFVLLSGCIGMIWFSYRRRSELTKSLQTNLAMQNELQQTNQHISQLLDENKALIKHTALVRESERQHLATELHDVFGQHLAAMDANLTVALNVTDNDDLHTMLQSVMDSTTHLRSITKNKLRNLKPPILKSIGLSGALQELFQDWQQSFPEISLSSLLSVEDDILDEETALTLYRAVQEGLVNVSRHAQATEVSIVLNEISPSLLAGNTSLHLRLSDNGKGLPPKEPIKGLGLIGIRERVEAQSGTFSLVTASPQGTQLELTIPLNLNKQGI